MFKSCVMLAAVVLLAACGAPQPREPTTQGVTSPFPAPPAGRGVYAIDPAQSEVRLLVYRAGAMANLGHNHVITHRAVGGWVRFAGNPTDAAFALNLPVADFVVDNAGARAQEGTDFFEEVPEEAKEGTLRNMLSAALLDAGRYPSITLTSVAVTADAGGLNANMRLEIAGHTSTLVVPFEVATSSSQISASGSIKLRQTALGLKPFSVMLGALQVQDEITVKFTLVAVAT